jgi:hypothetical protein
MVGRNYIIENRQAVTLLRLEQPVQVAAPIAHPDLDGDSHDVIFINDLNEASRWNDWNDWNKLSWAAVCDMPDVPWQKVTACSWHLRS